MKRKKKTVNSTHVTFLVRITAEAANTLKVKGEEDKRTRKNYAEKVLEEHAQWINDPVSTPTHL